MQHIVIIGCFDELMPTLAIPAKPLDIIAKNCAYRCYMAIFKAIP